MYTFLCGLALADLGYMFFSLKVFYFDSSLEIQCENLYHRDQVIIPICNSFKSTSDFIVICMTINRCRVMKNITELRIQALRKQATNENTSWSVYFQLLAALIISFALHLPYYFYRKNDHSICDDPEQEIGNTTTISPPPVLYDEQMWLIYYLIYIIIVRALPVIIIVSLNVILIQKLQVMTNRKKRMQRDRRTNQAFEDGHENKRVWSVMNRTSVKEQKLAFLSVIIAVSYLIFTFPGNVAFVVYNLPNRIESINDTYQPVTIITNFLEYLNYAANFYIYCAVHVEIRQSFGDLCQAILRFISCGRYKYEIRGDPIGPSTTFGL